MNLRYENNLYGSDDSGSLKHSEIVFKVIATIDKFNMINPGDSVLISISGGPDSVFLAYLFYLIKNKYKLELYSFHLDHMTRNGDSARDADFVENFCSGLKIKLFSEKIDAQKWCIERKMNFQEGARILRKNLLEKYLLENSINKIAIAHNADDNLETFFMNLLRGSGLRGVSGIKPVSGNLIRPLINSSKEEIVCFLDSNKIGYCIDKTNLEVKYLRNRIRNILIPELEDKFGISFKNKVLNTVETLRTVNDYIEAEALRIIKGIIKRQGINISDIYNMGFIKIPVAFIEDLDNSIKTALVFKLIELVNGEAKDIVSANINDILKFCYSGGENKKIDLLNGINFVKEKEHLYIYDGSKIDLYEILDENCLKLKSEKEYIVVDKDDIRIMLKSNITSNVILRVAGNAGTINQLHKTNMDFNETGIELTAGILNAPKIDKNTIMNSYTNEAYMDLDSIRFPVIVRNWRNGDKFYPLGMHKEKKLQDFFTDIKVPFHLRSSIPIFCDSEKIIWIGNFRIDDRIKIKDKTKKIFYLKITEN
ncbi:tRNA lysidine(34) synthetase TilS [bacterium]|nr:tRNA lysidine(34) synthetase TilS [bacterium]